MGVLFYSFPHERERDLLAAYLNTEDGYEWSLSVAPTASERLGKDLTNNFLKRRQIAFANYKSYKKQRQNKLYFFVGVLTISTILGMSLFFDPRSRKKNIDKSVKV